jgi:hypothetical protein
VVHTACRRADRGFLSCLLSPRRLCRVSQRPLPCFRPSLLLGASVTFVVSECHITMTPYSPGSMNTCFPSPFSFCRFDSTFYIHISFFRKYFATLSRQSKLFALLAPPSLLILESQIQGILGPPRSSRISEKNDDSVKAVKQLEQKAYRTVVIFY